MAVDRAAPPRPTGLGGGKYCLKQRADDRDDRTLLRHALSTPLPVPSPVQGAMPPLAFTMGVRSYSTV
ncbi:MAG: hypothetical protein WDW38_006583 [Sanguina aurantia]